MVNRSASELSRIIFKAASGSLALRMGALALGFASSILLARTMGASAFGVYAYFLAWVNFLYIPAMLGTDKLLVREVAILNSQKKWGLLRGIVSWCGRWVLLCAVLLAAMLIIAASHQIEKANLAVLMTASILIPILALTGLRQAVLKGLGAVVLGQLPENLIRPVLVIAAVSTWAIATDKQLPVLNAMSFNVGAALIAFAIGAYILRRRFPLTSLSAKSEFTPRPWMFWSLPLLLLGFSQAGGAQLPMLMLGFFASEHEIGLYAAAARVASLGNFFLLALNAAFAPQIAALYASGETDSLQSLVSRTSLWVTLLSLVPLLAFVFGGELVMSVFGTEFSSAAAILAVLAIGVFFSATMGSVGLLLTMTRNAKAALQAAIIALGLNLLFSVTLIPQYGAIGAAWAATGALIVGNLILGFFVYTKIGIIPTFAALALPRRDK